MEDFPKKYDDDENINKFLKNTEEESTILHEYFYKIDKRIDDQKVYNYKAKSFSRLLQDYENQLLMNLYDCFSFKKIKMKSINIKDIENYLYDKTNIPLKISIKPFECHYKNLDSRMLILKTLNMKINVILIKKSFTTTTVKNLIILSITFAIIVT